MKESPAPRRITETPPVFPCWIYHPNTLKWHHFKTEGLTNDNWDKYGWTHWLPDQPTAPTCVPDALPPSSPQAALGVREAVNNAAREIIHQYNLQGNMHPQTIIARIIYDAVAPLLAAPVPAGGETWASRVEESIAALVDAEIDVQARVTAKPSPASLKLIVRDVLVQFAPPDLTAEVALWKGRYEALANASVGTKETFIAVINERDSLRAQLTAAQAENEKLVKERDAMQGQLLRICHFATPESVTKLVESHLRLLRELNEKDKPLGFDSWEAYHAHIVAIRTRLAQLEAAAKDE